MRTETTVFIVGAGPVGMCLALLLDRLGVDSIVVERSPGTTTHPKARGLNARTMEIFRIWGLEESIRARSFSRNGPIIRWCEKLSGPFVGATHPAASNIGPTPGCLVAQDAIEAVLEEALHSLAHVELRRRSELVEFEQEDDKVTCRVRDAESNADDFVSARFMVACDGANSAVRDQLGIEMRGPQELAVFANHYFRAELGHVAHTRETLGYLVRPSDPEKHSFDLLPASADGSRFLYQQRLEPFDGEALTERELVEFMREAWEMPELDVERINVNYWRMSAQVAENFRSGNVFLAGDAAHRFPPTGGMGLNSGVQDVHNLAWKIAFVVSGAASPRLLDTYELERRPVAESNTAWSTDNFRRMNDIRDAYLRRTENPLAWREAVIDMDKQLHADGQAAGYTYERGALIRGDELSLPHDSRYYWPSDRPGARFPHVWLDPELTKSSIDWFDQDLVLVCGPEGNQWRIAGEEAAAGGYPLTVRELPNLGGPFTIDLDGAVLVRPDGHVAWQSPAKSGDTDYGAVLRWSLDTVLFREQAGSVCASVGDTKGKSR